MPTADEFERQRIREEFGRRRLRQWAMTLFVLPIAVLGLPRTHERLIMGVPTSAMLPFSLIAILFAVVFSLINWRCPACERYLGRSLWPRFCSRCGAELRS